tara:strand:+ start:878 stop:1672 length:795 start_codon:yes stop_codon:yes gene_type:complete
MIGLFFGESNFPVEILKKIIKNKIKYKIIDLTKKKNFKKDKNSYSVSIGQFGKILKILKDNKCKKVLFAGRVNKPKLSKLKLDLKGVFYMPRIIRGAKLGDAAIIKEIINILKVEKIKVINSLFFNDDLSLKNGIFSKIKPNNQDNQDIKIGIKTLNKLNKYNSSQGIIVRRKKVILIEGKGGTEKMLKNCKPLKNFKSGVLVKLPKKKQDLRVDLPTIGLKTLIYCKSSGLKGIVLKAKQHVFLERRKCINFANKNKMFLAIK